MTLKDLKKQVKSNSTRSFEVQIRGLPFWIWDPVEHKARDRTTKGRCCFNHVIGLPKKNDVEKPLFDYQKRILDALEIEDGSIQARHLWIKKARGSGISELMLRYMAWLCLKDSTYRGAQMAIVTGPREQLAIDLIERMKKLFEGLSVRFDTDKTVIVLNGCTIKAYPSNANTSRGQPNMKFILIDEADFFSPSEQRIARDVAEGYIGKSDPYIVMVSTPFLPGGLYEQIEKEEESRCVYRRLLLPYTECIGKIYSEQEIEKARASPSFEREYNLKYGYGEGNIFPYRLVDECTADFDLALGQGVKVLGIDPAYGSSKFAIVGLEQSLTDGTIYVKEAKQYSRPDPETMLAEIERLVKSGYKSAVLVDSARPEIADGLTRRSIDNVVRVAFSRDLSDMTVKASEAVNQKKVLIHPAFSDLAYQLKAIQYDPKGHPDKKRMDFDLGDAFLMAVHHLVIQASGKVVIVRQVDKYLKTEAEERWLWR